RPQATLALLTLRSRRAKLGGGGPTTWVSPPERATTTNAQNDPSGATQAGHIGHGGARALRRPLHPVRDGLTEVAGRTGTTRVRAEMSHRGGRRSGPARPARRNGQPPHRSTRTVSRSESAGVRPALGRAAGKALCDARCAAPARAGAGCARRTRRRPRP